MSFETEIKAHVQEDMVETVKNKLKCFPSCVEHGDISKFDVYWSDSEEGDPLFRTRKETCNGKTDVLFTAKPSKSKTKTGTEKNVELEFEASGDQWERILEFVKGTGYKVCRIKWKTGWHCTIEHKGFEIHAELLEVRYLGWFLEMEICTESDADLDFIAADKALREVLAQMGINQSAVEPLGYNKMLRALGHSKG
jgi:predicted adenylyl cyclase CyaB